MTEIEVTITQPIIEVKFESMLNTGGGGGAVDSVNGQTGLVVLTTTDINEGSNLYFTAARAIAALASTLADYVTNSSLATTLSSYATQAFVTSQGYITNVITALGFTPENVANKTTNISGAAGTYPDTPTVKAYADLLGTRAVVASNTVSFDNPKQFGSVASPRSGALLVDYTAARNGLVALVYHNDTALSFPLSWTNISSIAYTPSQNNVICVAFIGNSKAVLTILGVA